MIKEKFGRLKEFFKAKVGKHKEASGGNSAGYNEPMHPPNRFYQYGIPRSVVGINDYLSESNTPIILGLIVWLISIPLNAAGLIKYTLALYLLLSIWYLSLPRAPASKRSIAILFFLTTVFIPIFRTLAQLIMFTALLLALTYFFIFRDEDSRELGTMLLLVIFFFHLSIGLFPLLANLLPGIETTRLFMMLRDLIRYFPIILIPVLWFAQTTLGEILKYVFLGYLLLGSFLYVSPAYSHMSVLNIYRPQAEKMNEKVQGQGGFLSRMPSQLFLGAKCALGMGNSSECARLGELSGVDNEEVNTTKSRALLKGRIEDSNDVFFLSLTKPRRSNDYDRTGASFNVIYRSPLDTFDLSLECNIKSPTGMVRGDSFFEVFNPSSLAYEKKALVPQLRSDERSRATSSISGKCFVNPNQISMGKNDFIIKVSASGIHSAVRLPLLFIPAEYYSRISAEASRNGINAPDTYKKVGDSYITKNINTYKKELFEYQRNMLESAKVRGSNKIDSTYPFGRVTSFYLNKLVPWVLDVSNTGYDSYGPVISVRKDGSTTITLYLGISQGMPKELSLKVGSAKLILPEGLTPVKGACPFSRKSKGSANAWEMENPNLLDTERMRKGTLDSSISCLLAVTDPSKITEPSSVTKRDVEVVFDNMVYEIENNKFSITFNGKEMFNGRLDFFPLQSGVYKPFFESDYGSCRPDRPWLSSQGCRFHEGIDLLTKGNTVGLPVYSVRPGKIVKVGCNLYGGNRLTIADEDNPLLVYYYAHLHSYAKDWKVGDEVKAGELIGTVGNTRNCEKKCINDRPCRDKCSVIDGVHLCGEVDNTMVAHLHFGIYLSGRSLNPYNALVDAENRYVNGGKNA